MACKPRALSSPCHVPFVANASSCLRGQKFFLDILVLASPRSSPKLHIEQIIWIVLAYADVTNFMYLMEELIFEYSHSI